MCLSHVTDLTDKDGDMELDYRTIFKELNELEVDYLVIGGLAVNFHGVPRMTFDIDFAILLERENLLKAIGKFREWGYKPKVPIDPQDLANESAIADWIKDKGMKAFTFYSDSLPIAEIDLVFDIPVPYGVLKGRAVYMDLQGVKVPVISIQDLIQLKLHAGRDQDLADARYLKAIMERK